MTLLTKGNKMAEITFSTDVLNEAKEVAKQMLKNKSSFEKFDFAWENGSLFITTDKTKVEGLMNFDIDGTLFYIGVFTPNI